MKFYGLTKKEIEAIKSYNKNELNNRGVKAFKSNSDMITIEFDNNENVEVSINEISSFKDEVITFAELDNFMNKNKIATFFDIRGAFYLFEDIKNLNTSTLYDKLDLRKKLLMGLKPLVRVEEVYNKYGIKLKVLEFSNNINAYFEEKVTVRIGSNSIYIDYNREREDIIKPNFTVNDLVSLVKKEIKRIKKEIKKRKSFLIDDPEIVKLVKEYKEN